MLASAASTTWTPGSGTGAALAILAAGARGAAAVNPPSGSPAGPGSTVATRGAGRGAESDWRVTTAPPPPATPASTIVIAAMRGQARLYDRAGSVTGTVWSSACQRT